MPLSQISHFSEFVFARVTDLRIKRVFLLTFPHCDRKQTLQMEYYWPKITKDEIHLEMKTFLFVHLSST